MTKQPTSSNAACNRTAPRFRNLCRNHLPNGKRKKKNPKPHRYSAKHTKTRNHQTHISFLDGELLGLALVPAAFTGDSDIVVDYWELSGATSERGEVARVECTKAETKCDPAETLDAIDASFPRDHHRLRCDVIVSTSDFRRLLLQFK